MSAFDPNAASHDRSGIFGLPFCEQEAKLVFLPIPWEVTTSYGGGTSKGPQAILEASRQVDLYHREILRPYEAGFFLLPESPEIHTWNREGKILAQNIHTDHEQSLIQKEKEKIRINELGSSLNAYVLQATRKILKNDQIAAIIGGDHSVPFGALTAIAEKYPSFGILHFDAHSDTRAAFEGFTWSHASIMHNVLEQIPAVTKLIQVGIRDYCEAEAHYIESQKDRVHVFFDSDLAAQKFSGTPWKVLAEKIITHLPEYVWISFDIDGLDPRFCPNTGTPVPGGLDFNEAVYLIRLLVESGRKIIGFDLNEVAPDLNNPHEQWNANVGARLLYQLSAWLLASQKYVPFLSHE